MPSFVERVKKHAFRESALRQRGLPYPLLEQDIANAEDAPGFHLPDLLRQLYLQVANGGFGPGQNYPFPGGMNRLSQSVELYVRQRSYGPDDGDWEVNEVVWPEGLLPICDWGCGRFSSLDCIHAPFPVVYHHAELRENESGIKTCASFDEMRERLDEHGFFGEFGGLYGNSWVVARSFQAWLTAWLTAWLDDQEIEIIGYPKTMGREEHRHLPYME